LQSNNLFRRNRRVVRRVGADAAFAKAMARSEFGRFYTDDAEQAEIRRSLARSMLRRQDNLEAAKPKATGSPDPKTTKAGRRSLWAAPVVRHRRSEIAASLARLKKACKADAESEG
jgi:hypothetical protein